MTRSTTELREMIGVVIFVKKISILVTQFRIVVPPRGAYKGTMLRAMPLGLKNRAKEDSIPICRCIKM